MAALTSVSSSQTGTAPAPVAVASSDTIAAGQFGPTGVDLRVMNAGGTVDNVTVVDPNLTVIGGTGTLAAVTVPITTGVRTIFIPRAAIDPATQVATVQHSFITTVTCEVWRR
jgi:hypothetical protein